MKKTNFTIPDGDKCNGCNLIFTGFAGRTPFTECFLHKNEVLPDEEGNIYKCERCLNCDSDNLDADEYFKSFE